MRYLIFWLISLGGIMPLLGQAEPLAFDFLDTRAGLAAEAATVILQDSRNLMWVGTQSGLQTYDGYTFRKLPTPGLQEAPGIKALAEDSVHNIWIATAASGLRRYNRQTGALEVFDDKGPEGQRLKGLGVTHLNVSRDGAIWAGSPTGLYTIKQADSIRIEMIEIPFDTLSEGPQKVEALGIGPMGQIWVAIEGQGIAVFETEENRWESFTYSSLPFLESSVSRFYVDKAGNFWVLTTAGPFLLTQKPLATSTLELIDSFPPVAGFLLAYRYPKRLFDALSPVARFPHDMVQRDNGEYLFLHMFGLFRVNQPLDQMEFFSLAELGIPSKGFNVPLNIFQDKHQGIWIPTMEGLMLPADKSPAFRAYRPAAPAEKVMVRAMLEDQAGQKWMGVEDGGIYLFDKNVDTPYLHLHLKPGFPGHQPHFIMSIGEIDRNTFWVGTYRGGLNKLKVSRDASGRVNSWSNTVYLHGQGQKAREVIYVYDVLDDTLAGITWVADFDGLCRIGPDKAFTRFKLPVANVLCRQTSGDLLVGTDNGLFMWSPMDDTVRAFSLEAYNDFASYRIEALLEQEDTLWIGTNRGLFAVDKVKKEAVRYDETTGLTHQSIRGLLLDHNHTLWVSTLNGLCRKRGAEFESFTIDQGVHNNVFIARALSLTSSGQILAGGDNGMVGFWPDQLEDIALYGIHLSDFQLFGESVLPGTKTPTAFQLSSPVNSLHRLILSHRERMISIRFAGLGYRQADHFRYAYRLRGFDDRWKPSDPGQRLATFTNLAAGDYTLEIRAAGPTGPWQVSRELPITVLAPWWRRWWAWAIYATLMALLIWWAWTRRLESLRREMAVKRRIAQARQAEREKVRAESARDFHDEAGSQLTKLMLYSNLLRTHTASQPQTDVIDKIQHNIQRMSETMRDFIWMLDSRHDSLGDTLLRIRYIGESLFEPSQLEFRFKGNTQLDGDLPLTPAVRRHLVLICKEALHNALKYSSGHTVELQTAFLPEKGILQMHIADDGIGFQPDDLGRINGLHNMESRAKEIGGAFSLESTPGIGTMISLSVPIHPNGG